MYKIAFGILHNDADAQDAVSEAFYKIAKNFKKFVSEGVNFEYLVVIIIRSISLNFYKSNKKRSLKERFFKASDEDDFSIDFEFENIADEILTLPEIIRDTMYLRYIYGLSVKEIADINNCGTTTIYKRIEKGKELLKEKLNEGCCSYE